MYRTSKFRSFVALAAGLALASVLSACGGGGSSPSSNTLTYMTVNNYKELSATDTASNDVTGTLTLADATLTYQDNGPTVSITSPAGYTVYTDNSTGAAQICLSTISKYNLLSLSVSTPQPVTNLSELSGKTFTEVRNCNVNSAQTLSFNNDGSATFTDSGSSQALSSAQVSALFAGTATPLTTTLGTRQAKMRAYKVTVGLSAFYFLSEVGTENSKGYIIAWVQPSP